MTARMIDLHSESVCRIFSKFLDRKVAHQDKIRQTDFALARGVYEHYFGATDAASFERFFNLVLAHQALSAHEQTLELATFLLAENLKPNLSEQELDKILGSPCIYTTIHMGSYRLINFFLAHRGVDLCLMVTPNVYQKQARVFIETYRQWGLNGRFTVLNSDDPISIRKCLRLIRDGYSVLLYLDGNSGVGGMNRRDESLISISFLHKKILARKGAAFLSALAKVPIVPVITTRNSVRRYDLDFHDAIQPAGRTEDEIFAATQKIFDIFSSVVERYPDQWEAWLYLYKWVSIELRKKDAGAQACSPEAQCIAQFNFADHEILRYGSTAALLHKPTMTTTLLSDQQHDLLRQHFKPGFIRCAPPDSGSTDLADMARRFISEGVLLANPSQLDLASPAFLGATD